MSGMCVRLAALHPVKDGLARVFPCPDRSVAGCTRLPSHDHGFFRLDERMRRTRWTRLGRRSLAKEVIFFDRREAGMRVGRADHPELVRIDAELTFQLETVLER